MEDKKSGVVEKLQDLEFADDICLITPNKELIQNKTSELKYDTERTGNIGETKFLTSKHNQAL